MYQHQNTMTDPPWFADARRAGFSLPSCICAMNIGWVWDPAIPGWDKSPPVPGPLVPAYPHWFADAYLAGIDHHICISARNVGWVWDPAIPGWDMSLPVQAPPVPALPVPALPVQAPPVPALPVQAPPVPAVSQVDQCAICIDDIISPHTLPCGHSFCHACIHTWIARNATCPCCRRPTP